MSVYRVQQALLQLEGILRRNSGVGGAAGVVRQRAGRLGGRGLLLRDARPHRGLLVRLHRGRDVGEVALLHVGLHPAAEALAAGHPARGALQGRAAARQVAARHLVLLVGHPAAGHVQGGPGRALPAALPRSHEHALRIHRGNELVHVHLRRDEVVLRLPVRGDEVHSLHLRDAPHHPLLTGHREHRRHLGRLRTETQVLHRQQGVPPVARH